MSTILLSILIFGTATFIVVKKIRRGLFSGCSDCQCDCGAKGSEGGT
ncbi:hypothetical protein SAMN02745116_00131 [Pilibacter termitis]|uniref:Virus attachment protein p12 family protein n=1 Tax=Pilibacter termitis TaxID=263852 RepID=A0A1T4K7L8_9ENTE|nr:hypothetical protein SAMN02745116_00131 [Pilibacter termitis]